MDNRILEPMAWRWWDEWRNMVEGGHYLLVVRYGWGGLINLRHYGYIPGAT
jgi:hypothetical protein